MIKNRKCKTCMYRVSLNGRIACQYILITEQRRGCSVEKCDKYKKGDKRDDV